MVDWRLYLNRYPSVIDGQLSPKETRVPVTVILDSLAEGSSRQEIFQSYRSHRPEHEDAVIAYSAELAKEDSLLPLWQV